MSEETTVPDTSEYCEWLTIAEAADVLGVSERQARRYAKRLPDDDRREPDVGPDTATGLMSKSMDTTPDTATGLSVTRVRRLAVVAAYEAATGRKIERETADTATDATPVMVSDTSNISADITADTRPAQAGHDDRRDDDQRTRDREEIAFLRGLVEQHQRSEAELRAALREALRAMPKAIEAGSESTAQAPTVGTLHKATETPQTGEPTQSGGGKSNGSQREMRPLWKVILGIR
jgi:hypothetical protein